MKKFTREQFEAVVRQQIFAALLAELLENRRATPEQIEKSDCQGIRAYAAYEAKFFCANPLVPDGMPETLTAQQFRERFYLNGLSHDVSMTGITTSPIEGMTETEKNQFRKRAASALANQPDTDWKQLKPYAVAWDFDTIPLRFFSHEAAAVYLSSVPHFGTITYEMVRTFQRKLGLHTADPVVRYRTASNSYDVNVEKLQGHGLTLPAQLHPVRKI